MQFDWCLFCEINQTHTHTDKKNRKKTQTHTYSNFPRKPVHFSYQINIRHNSFINSSTFHIRAMRAQLLSKRIHFKLSYSVCLVEMIFPYWNSNELLDYCRGELYDNTMHWRVHVLQTFILTKMFNWYCFCCRPYSPSPFVHIHSFSPHPLLFPFTLAEWRADAQRCDCYGWIPMNY